MPSANDTAVLTGRVCGISEVLHSDSLVEGRASGVRRLWSAMMRSTAKISVRWRTQCRYELLLSHVCWRTSQRDLRAYRVRCEEENSIVETCSGREPPVGGFASAKPAALSSRL